MKMTRRSMAAGLAVSGASSLITLPAQGADIADEWRGFRHRYVSDDGRVIDTGNGNISHSEGQGYGMLFAQSAGDRSNFDLIWGWTRANLTRENDSLHAWKWQPAAPHVTDTNTATDGDLLIAWALSRAGLSWSEPDYTRQARMIFDALSQRATQSTAEYKLLLPGLHGFTHAHRTVVNPSYYIFPALKAAAAQAPTGIWPTVLRDGVRLIERGVFGKYNLPPDWLAVPIAGGAPRLAKNWPPRFSYDAIRIPLYMAWGGVLADPLRAALDRFWGVWGLQALPGWVDLTTGERSSYNAPPGFQAVAIVSDPDRWGQHPLPGVRESGDYYSAALTLLAHIAATEIAR
ncbi:hypothetical protein A0U93_11800 [Neoasaia chiangmaiensis]|uniref:cellulase n=2 Tax=Neoasaia chiangmaiensis TaxID=320497 RepID=A0A1U9KRK9_9PROT|nr:hypothetical protein A0U93_11800 [Neoasaia chiangmaiensis]